MKEKILTILRECDGFVSGQELSDLLGVSRTAVWKAIQRLEEDGYEIDAVRNKGYRLLTEPDLLTEESISRRLATEWAGQSILAEDVIDSTNNQAKRLAEEDAPHGLLVIAEQQTQGKGRMGRPWRSPRGSGVWMSLLLRPEIKPVQASGLTLVMAMAVQQALADVAGISCAIKWPNDIVADGRKICGILTEMSADPDRINHIVIGLGINVKDEAFPEEIKDVAASVYQISGKQVCRAELVAAILKRFEQFYEKYIQTGNLRLLKDEYNEKLINRGRMVRVLDPAGEYTATAEGITDEGALIVDREGERTEIISGEVSVRGVYGYV